VTVADPPRQGKATNAPPAGALTLQQEPPRDDVVRDFPRRVQEERREVAIAQPERGVIALEGDGSILMSLGCLTTVATARLGTGRGGLLDA
jgi:hypothetical protein